MRMNDVSLYYKMKNLGADGAGSAIFQSLKSAEYTKHIAEIFNKSLSGSDLHWGRIVNSLKRLNVMQSKNELIHCIEDIDKIIALCILRSQQESKAQKYFENEKTFYMWLDYGHLNAHTLKPILIKWAKDLYCFKDIDINSFTKSYGRWYGLLQYIRSVQELSYPNLPDPTPEQWESVLLYIMKKKNVPQSECDVFGKCEFCWRFVPLSQATGHNNLYCAEHQWNTYEYKRYNKILKIVGCKKIDDMINKLYIKSKEHFVAYHNNLPENWQNLFVDDIVKLADSISFDIEYHPMLIEKYFPKVCEYVRRKGGDCGDFYSIVAIIDKISDNIEIDIQTRWNALHKVFSSNLALFRKELCQCEILLTLYENIFSQVKRGGKRVKQIK